MTNNDPQTMTKEEIAAALNMLAIPECTMFVHRADRHDPTSRVQAITLHCSGEMTYEAITQLAGAFETPHITFTPRYRSADDEDNAHRDACEECVEPYFEIIIKWEAAPEVHKVRESWAEVKP